MAKSGFFRGCLSNGFKEAKEGEINLSTGSPDSFNYFVRWLYRGLLEPAETTKTSLIDLYFLADELICPELSNGVMDLVQQYSRVPYVKLADLHILIEKGLQDSRLGRFLIHQLGWEMAEGMERYIEDDENWAGLLGLGAEVMRRVLQKSATLVVSNDETPPCHPDPNNMCEWHMHANESERKECRRWDEFRKAKD